MSQLKAKDEILSMFGKRRKTVGEGMTVKEICDKTGRPPAWVRTRLADGIKQGRVKVGSRTMKTITDISRPTPIYIFVKEK